MSLDIYQISNISNIFIISIISNLIFLLYLICLIYLIFFLIKKDLKSYFIDFKSFLSCKILFLFHDLFILKVLLKVRRLFLDIYQLLFSLFLLQQKNAQYLILVALFFQLSQLYHQEFLLHVLIL